MQTQELAEKRTLLNDEILYFYVLEDAHTQYRWGVILDKDNSPIKFDVVDGVTKWDRENNPFTVVKLDHTSDGGFVQSNVQKLSIGDYVKTSQDSRLQTLDIIKEVTPFPVILYRAVMANYLSGLKKEILNLSETQPQISR